MKHAEFVMACLALLLSGCVVGPDYERPPTVLDDQQRYQHARPIETAQMWSSDPNSAWWEHFGDPLTADLVRQALQNNTDLQAQAARVLQAEALLRQSRGAEQPHVEAGFSARRFQVSNDDGNFDRRQTGDGQGGDAEQPSSFSAPSRRQTSLEPSLSVSYVVDLFGRLRRATEASQATLLSRRANFEALQHSIIAQIIRSRVEIATIQQQLEIARNNTRNWQAALEIAERRYRSGLVGPLEVHVARENVARSQSLEPALELSLQQAYHALDVLLGRAPGTTQQMAPTLAELPDLQTVPTGLPAELLDRRPDLREAELRLHAATARIGVNEAELYPDLTLSGSIGYSADRFADLFQSETLIWNLAANLTQPLFQGGQIRARIEEARAVVREELALYTGTVLQALREVEDALINETKLQEQLTYLTVRFQEAEASERLAQDRYLKGVESLTTVLETERSRREAEDQLTTLKRDIWIGRVDLLLALGGDWRTDAYQPGTAGPEDEATPVSAESTVAAQSPAMH